ncbi:hypothetical protein K501DRAFT_267270 [Backusella circina FSU 941]|nr:hypothetical protein K501DRAFT_267270 [Backusella circina FSU 941]
MTMLGYFPLVSRFYGSSSGLNVTRDYRKRLQINFVKLPCQCLLTASFQQGTGLVVDIGIYGFLVYYYFNSANKNIVAGGCYNCFSSKVRLIFERFQQYESTILIICGSHSKSKSSQYLISMIVKKRPTSPAHSVTQKSLSIDAFSTVIKTNIRGYILIFF